VIDPRAFAGLDAFTRQTGEVARQCRASRPAQPGAAVRTPGERGLALAQRQRETGVKLYPTILPTLEPWAAKLAITMPEPGA
jgi:LDH2 family malate/lactate/ureidoglycolate dehydrogenase